MTWIYLLFIFFQPFSKSEGFFAKFDADQEAIIIIGLGDLNQEHIPQKVAVYFGETIEKDQPQVIGHYSKKGSDIYFIAKYGFTEGKNYTVVFKKNSTAKDSEIIKDRIVVHIPFTQREPSTFVKQVFPTTDQIPMNQLKFYIEFSAPMRYGNAYEYIKLYRLPEKILEPEAFLASTDELWDPSRQRLTIFFDPGRIKRGVQPNLQLGLPLVEGRKYQLVIDQTWLDINGVQMTGTFEKNFEVIAVDRTSPDPDHWSIDIPKCNTSKPISIDFKESMDYGLLHSTLTIKKQSGEFIEGEIELKALESQWFFYPEKPWGKGKYQIIINSWLEDLAGNNLSRKFDVDLSDPADKPKNIEEILIPFEINTQSDF